LDVFLDRFGGGFIGAGGGRLDNDGLGDFSGCVVGDGDDGAVCDGRVGEKVCLELGGCYLKTLFVGGIS
jgi:hypothetical protein